MTPRTFRIPVPTEERAAPHLERVADETGLDTDAVIRLHLQPEYIVRRL